MRATAENMFGAQYSGINIGLVFADHLGSGFHDGRGRRNSFGADHVALS